MKTIIVTDLEYKKAEEVFQKEDRFICRMAPGGEKELSEAVREEGAFGVIVGVESYKKELYDALPKGGVIARFGVGHNGIDKILAAEKGIFCTNTPGVLDESVAESAIAMMLMAARSFVPAAGKLKNGIWENFRGMELAGKTLLICGCGSIGCKVAAIARNGLGMKVIGCSPRPPKIPEIFEEHFTDPREVFPKADILSLHLPETEETRDFINAERLALLPPSSILINTARGGVLDENALFDALKEGKLAGAALDVYKNEPYFPMDPERDLRNLGNVLMLPHLGSSTKEACVRMASAALENIAFCEAKAYEKMSLLPPFPPGIK